MLLPAWKKTSLSGLEVSLYKTSFIINTPHVQYYESRIVIDQTKLKVVHHFTHLGCLFIFYD